MLTPEQASANADAIAKHAARQMSQLGFSDVEIVERFASHLAENEGGRGGVYCYEVRDKDGILNDVVIAPSVEEE